MRTHIVVNNNQRCARGSGWPRALTRACASIVVALFAQFPAAAADTDRPLRVQLTWTHQTQFAGYYLAKTRALQGHEAMKIDFIEGGPEIDPLERLVKGEADVAIGYLAGALDARAKGADIVNVAQVFTRPGMALACPKTAKVRGPADLVGRSVGVWEIGDQISVHLWLQRAQVPESSVALVPQAADARDVISGRVPCGTVMLYNEYLSLLRSGLKAADLMVVRFGDAGLGMLEDGLYVRRASLDDPAFRRRLVGFVKAMAAGWQRARERPDEAVAATLARAPALNTARQRRMLESILTLIQADHPIGLLDVAAYQRTLDIYTHDTKDAERIRRAALGGWTHDIWNEAIARPAR